jgi:hypothetical protein
LAQLLAIVGPTFTLRVPHHTSYPAAHLRRAGDARLQLEQIPPRPDPTMGVVIEREEWALTPLAYPLLSLAALAAVALLPYFSPRTATHAAGSSSPFAAGTAPFLRTGRAFLALFSLAAGELTPISRPCRSERAGPDAWWFYV